MRLPTLTTLTGSNGVKAPLVTAGGEICFTYFEYY